MQSLQLGTSVAQPFHRRDANADTVGEVERLKLGAVLSQGHPYLVSDCLASISNVQMLQEPAMDGNLGCVCVLEM